MSHYSDLNFIDKFSHSFERYVSYMDAFRLPLRLNLKRRIFFKTGLGGFLTSVAIAIVLYQLVTQLVSMANRDAGVFTTDTNFSDDPGPLELNSSNFIFAMKIDQDMPLDQQIVKFTLEIGSFIRNADGSQTRKYISIPLEICTKDYFQGFEESYTKYGLSNAFCPSARSYSIAGSYIADNYTFIKLQVSKCTNTTTQVNNFNITCLPSESIDSTLSQGIRVHLFFSSDVLTLDNYTSSVKRYLINEDWTLTPQAFRKSVDLYIQEQNIQTDTDLVSWASYRRLDHKRTITYNQRSREQQVSLDGDKLLSLFFRKNYFTTQITRTYPKVINVLSSVGGFLNALIAIFGIIVAVYAEYRYYKDFADDVYEFEKIEDQDQDKDKPPAIEPLAKVVSKNIKRVNSDLATSKAKSTEKFILNYADTFASLLPSKQSLRLSFLQFIRSLICPCKEALRKKRTMYLKARSKALMDLDVIQIVKKLKEFDKLKEILLNPHQIELLSYTPTLCISPQQTVDPDDPFNMLRDPRTKKEFEKDPHSESVLKFLKLLNSYRMVKHSQSSGLDSIVNGELLEKIDPEMKAALERLDRELNNNNNTSEVGQYLKNNFNIDDPNSQVDEIVEEPPKLNEIILEVPDLKILQTKSGIFSTKSKMKPSLFKRIDDVEKVSKSRRVSGLFHTHKDSHLANSLLRLPSLSEIPRIFPVKKDAETPLKS